MSLETTFERIAVALEQLAANSNSNTSALEETMALLEVAAAAPDRDPDTLELPGIEAPDGVQAAAETPKATRNRKPKPDPVVEPEVPAMTGAEAEAALHGHSVVPDEPVVVETVVATKPAPEYKDVQAAATAFSQVGNRDGVLAIFAGFDIKTLKDLKPADFQRAIDAFDGATAALAGAA